MRKCVCSRAFLMSFFCTVQVLLFVFGMLMVDAEGRRLSFNDNAPPAEMLYQADGKAFLKINAFGAGRENPRDRGSEGVAVL